MPTGQFTVERVDRVPVEVPYRPVPERNMDRELPHWRYFEVLELELADGTVGHGETMLFYGPGRTEDGDVERALGATAAGLLRDDSLGPGLQMALFDAVGRATGVPAHRLLGDQVRDRVPISWWCIDMPAADWLAEAREAIDRGYTALKLKGRPWFDLRSQIETLDAELPDWFSVDVDFNGTLLDAERALPVLETLAESGIVSHYEEPIDAADADANRRLSRTLDVDTVLHYGDPGPLTAACLRICDGFVVSGGASALAGAASVTAAADMPFWLQLVGTGITAAFSVQCGAVFEQATWPAINCHQLYEHDLLADPIAVEDGLATVPEAPGLGHDVDMDAVESYRVTRPETQPYPLRLIEADWPDGPTIYYSGNDDQLLTHARAGGMPYYEREVSTRTVPDDGSEEWRDLAERAADEPVRAETSRF